MTRRSALTLLLLIATPAHADKPSPDVQKCTNLIDDARNLAEPA